MFIYLLIFVMLSINVFYAIANNNSAGFYRKERFSVGFFIVFLLLIGFRHETGGDWFSYVQRVDDAKVSSLIEAIAIDDPAYALFNWLSANIFGTTHFSNFVCALIFCVGLFKFAQKNSNSATVLMLAFPYLVIVVGMGYIRQAAAIGLIMYGITKVLDGKWFQFIVFVALASLFHKSAFFIVFFGVFSNLKSKLIVFFVLVVAIISLYIVILMESIEYLTKNYLEAEYEAAGAWVRVIMNIFPAMIFLIFYKYFARSSVVDQKFWRAFAFGAFILPAALLLSPSSVVVDRMALYWYPLQLMVWANLSRLFNRRVWRYTLSACLVVYSGLSLIVWLFWSPNSMDWLPYRFFLFEFI